MADVHGSPAAAPQMPAADRAGPAPAPYEPGSPSPIYAGGDADAGGRDIVSGTVVGAVASAEARLSELQGDTYGQGSVIGDLMTMPTVPEDIVTPTGGFGYPMGNQPGA